MTADARKLPKARGVGRMGDNDKAIMVHFDRPLTDDELRTLHEMLARRPMSLRCLFGFHRYGNPQALT